MGLASPLHSVERPVRAVLSGAGAAVDRIDRIMHSIEQLATALGSIEREMRGMRTDVQTLGDEVRGLRGDLATVDQRVHDIVTTMHAIDDQVGTLDGHMDVMTESLKRIDAIARGVPRLGRRGRAAVATAKAAEPAA